MRLVQTVCEQILQITGGVDLGAGVLMSGQGRLAAPCKVYPGMGEMSSVSLGGYAYLPPVFEANFLDVGNYSSIANGFRVGLGHPLNLLTASPVAWRSWLPGCEFPGRVSENRYPSTQIGSDVWIGADVIVKAGVKIGDGCFIGAGSVVTRDVPAYSVAAGNPCRVIRPRFDERVLERVLQTQWFNYDWRDEHLDWSNPDATLDGIEAALARGFRRRFVTYYYEVEDDGVKLYREDPGQSPVA